MKVLAVDDNPMAGILLSDILQELGFQPCIARNASAAMKMFEEETPRICVLDWMMPDTDGLKLACEIRKHRAGGDAYILMLSAKQDLQSVELAYQLGVDDFLMKPVAPEELRGRLRAAGRVMELRQRYSEKCAEIAALSSEVARLKAAA